MVENSELINIGPKEAQNRLIIGIVMAVVAVIMITLLFVLKLSSLWAIIVFFPLVGAFLGYLQSSKKTWIARAAQGERNFDRGVEKIEDEELVSKLKAKANLIVSRSVLYAAIITILLVMAIEITRANR